MSTRSLDGGHTRYLNDHQKELSHACRNGVMPIPMREHNLLALALDERLNELPSPSAPSYEFP